MAKDREYWKAAADKAHENLAELRAERDERMTELERLNTEILQWEQILSSLNPVAVGIVTTKSTMVLKEVAALPLAEACRKILQRAREYQTAKGIRDVLEASGYDLAQHTNPLASIHGVLKRMAERGTAEQMETSGKTFYRWKGLSEIEEAIELEKKALVASERGRAEAPAVSESPSATKVWLRRAARRKLAGSAVDQMIEKVEEDSRTKRSNFLKAVEEAGKPKKS